MKNILNIFLNFFNIVKNLFSKEEVVITKRDKTDIHIFMIIICVFIFVNFCVITIISFKLVDEMKDHQLKIDLITKRFNHHIKK